MPDVLQANTPTEAAQAPAIKLQSESSKAIATPAHPNKLTAVKQLTNNVDMTTDQADQALHILKTVTEAPQTSNSIGIAEHNINPTNREKTISLESQNALNHMQQLEDTYLDTWPYKDTPRQEKSPKTKIMQQELRARYDSPTISHEYILQTATSEAADRGVDIKIIPQDLAGIEFANDTDGKTQAHLLELSQKLFQENPQISDRKRIIVDNQTQEYLQLLKQAQQDRSVPANITADQVYKLVSENIAILAMQENASAEVTLGTHGVFHLVDHNITTAMVLVDALAEKGVPLTAKDKLKLHMINLYHDVGYASDPVRMAMRKNGLRGQDGGHNVLAAKVIEDIVSNPDSSWNAVFNPQDLSEIHDVILYHDVGSDGKAHINLQPNPDASLTDMRLQYLTNIEQIADNTHAFADKLPPILYDTPETLIYLRAMKTAAETGDSESVTAIRTKLAEKINSRSDISEQDKKYLGIAVGTLTPDSYKFAAGRICGTNPEISLDDNNRVNISVSESAMHQEVTQLFDLPSLDQLRKFIADLTGKGKDTVNLDTDRIESDSLVISLRHGEGKKSTEMDDYEQQVDTILKNNKEFVEFAHDDAPLGARQKQFDGLHKAYTTKEISDSEFAKRAADALGYDPGVLSITDLQNLLLTRVQHIQSLRNTNLKTIMDKI